MQLSSRFIMLLLIACTFTLTACHKPQPLLYHYNDYSNAYYAYKKDMSPESLLKLQLAMEEAIGNAGESKSGRVPPGMYANVGYIYLKSGNPQKAITAFTKEKKTYPESAHFMDRMIKKVELTEGDKDV
jgi:hypothetical protein